MPALNPTTYIEVDQLKFLIMDAPSDESLDQYIQTMKEKNVSDLVRTCELSYREDIVQSHGIRCHELAFPDGDPPPDRIIDEWLQLVDWASVRSSCIAIHCVAGLGRAPVLVAIALIERAGYDNLDAIELLRSRRKGSINRKQLHYLCNYKPRPKKKRSGGCCFWV